MQCLNLVVLLLQKAFGLLEVFVEVGRDKLVILVILLMLAILTTCGPFMRF